MIIKGHSGRRRRAFTLVELLIVMAGVSVALAFGSAILVSALKVQRAATNAFGRQALRTVLADQFRADVGEAAAAPDSGGSMKAAPQCVILRRQDGSFIVYRWQEDHLERMELDGACTVQRKARIGPEAANVRLSRQGKLLSLFLIDAPFPGKEAKEFEIAAALGGDHR
jgi:prepilin-type N-terminal cleavage/methylation domain-containing protein